MITRSHAPVEIAHHEAYGAVARPSVRRLAPAAHAEVSRLLFCEPFDESTFARASALTARIVPCAAITLVGSGLDPAPMLWLETRRGYPEVRPRTHLVAPMRWLALPLVIRERCLGVLSVARRGLVLGPEEKAFLAGIAGRMTLALATTDTVSERVPEPQAHTRARESARQVNAVVSDLLETQVGQRHYR